MSSLAFRLHRWAWLWLLLSGPLFLFITPARTPVLLLLPLLFSLRRLATGHWLPRTPLDRPILGLLLMVLVSLFATPDLAYSLPKVAGVLFGVTLFYTTVETATRSPRHLWATVGVMAAFGLGLALIGLLGWRTTVAKIPGINGIANLLPARQLTLTGAEEGINPNEVAGVILWTAPLLLAVSVAGLTHWREWREQVARRAPAAALAAAGLGASGLAAILLLTQSRSGLAGYALAAVWLAFLAAARRRGGALALAALLAGGVALGIGLVGWEQVVVLWKQSLASAPSGQAAWSALSSRPEIWARGLYALQDFPLTGMGMNMFRQQVHALYPYVTIAPGVDLGHAHNQFLQAGLDLGLPGLVAYLGVWLTSGFMLARSWRSAQPASLRWLAAGLSASLVGSLVFGSVDAVALGARPGFVFWLLLGVVAALPAVTPHNWDAG